MIHCCPQVLDYIHKHILDEKKGYVMGWPDKFIDAVASASPVWTGAFLYSFLLTE